MLELWYQGFGQILKVVDFIKDVRNWAQEGFLDEKIWIHLAQTIDLDMLPDSPEQRIPKEQPSIIPSKEGNLA